ncbi:MAG: hypothetical protein ABFC85_08145 [Rectinema sp.]|nr:hypothetical protein [Betaproteobacteria bacterium]
MAKNKNSDQLLEATLVFKQIETDFLADPKKLPSQDHLLAHLEKTALIAKKATKGLIKSKKNGSPVTTHSIRAYQALQSITAATTVLAEEAGLVAKLKSKVTRL